MKPASGQKNGLFYGHCQSYQRWHSEILSLIMSLLPYHKGNKTKFTNLLFQLIPFMKLKACFQSGRNDNGQSGSAANEGLMTAQMKAQQRFLKQLSWVPCERTVRIRRSRQATETSCVPLLENQALTKVSWVLFSFFSIVKSHTDSHRCGTTT